MNPISTFFRLYLTWQVRNKSLNELIAAADASGKMIVNNLADKVDTPESRKRLRHIIGIERWGQRRLQTLLGEPLLQDEYDGYQPDESLDFKALKTEFKATRAETVKLTKMLQKKGLAKTGMAHHNGMGDVPITVWTRYLTMHAEFEHKRIKSAVPADDA